MEYQHIPVLLEEVIDNLQIQPGQTIIDCTLGGAGYTVEIAKRVGSTGQVLSIDLDNKALDHARALIKEHGLGNITLVHDNFANLLEIADEHNIKEANGIVMDLGLSSAQLADTERGFSFKQTGPLDMAFGKTEDHKGDTTYIVNQYNEKALTNIMKNYGEERYAKLIAQKIIAYRKEQPITTTEQLVSIISEAVPAGYRRQAHLHFATRTFQALRIATNQELASLEKVLPQALQLLAPQGRIAVVSFHSLEDRIVKQFFKKEATNCLCPPQLPTCRCDHQAQLKIINKKIITPTQEEIKNNPRSRSSKLRVAEKK